MRENFIDIDAAVLFGSPNLTGTAERNLLLGVLERAILDFVGNDRREIDDAERWLFEDTDEPSYAPFSFPWICIQLDLDMKATIEKIKTMPKRGKSRVAPWYTMKKDTINQERLKKAG